MVSVPVSPCSAYLAGGRSLALSEPQPSHHKMGLTLSQLCRATGLNKALGTSVMLSQCWWKMERAAGWDG